MPELNNKQREAKDKCFDFVKQTGLSGGVFAVSGLAGTGKTTTLVDLVETLQAEGLRPAVCTPTGKAAHVINTKQSSFTATTLHRVLTERPIDGLQTVHKRLDELDLKSRQPEGLTPEEQSEQQRLFEDLDSKSTNRLNFKPISPDSFFNDYDLLVFDESSMIGMSTYEDLIAPISCPKVFFGDAGQLPPVQDRPAVDLKHAAVRLTDIMRQHEHSGILKLAHHIQRKRDYLPLSEIAKYRDLTIRKDFVPEMVEGFENDHQVLCWKNKTRHEVSRRIRDARGVQFKNEEFAFLPKSGEYIMIDENDDSRRLLKGQLMRVKQTKMYRPDVNPFMAQILCVDEQGVDRSFMTCLTDLMEGYDLPFQRSETFLLNAMRWAERDAVRVMWPYCLTVHKAQGSEWDKVLYLGEMPMGNPEWSKHAYTAVTRARDSVVVCSLDFKYDKTG